MKYTGRRKKDALFLSYLKGLTKKDYNIKNIKLDTKPCSYFLNSPPIGGGPFSKDTLDFFGVSGECYVDKFGVTRALIPIYDSDNVLAGYSARDTRKGIKKRKYLLIGNIASGDILYNLNNAKNSLSDYIIVVEGFKAVWRLHEYQYDNVVCCMGSLLTPNQVKLLIRTLKKVVLFFDPDSAGIQGTIITNNKYGLLLPLIPVISSFNVDPADLTKEEADSLLYQYMKNNKNILI